MKIRVIKPFVQADIDPSKPHIMCNPGEYDVPEWLALKAIDRGDATEVKRASKKGKYE